MGTAIKHPMPGRVKPSFVIFDIRALWRSALKTRCTEEDLQWRSYVVWTALEGSAHWRWRHSEGSPECIYHSAFLLSPFIIQYTSWVYRSLSKRTSLAVLWLSLEHVQQAICSLGCHGSVSVTVDEWQHRLRERCDQIIDRLLATIAARVQRSNHLVVTVGMRWFKISFPL